MMSAIACFALVLPALTLSQGYSEGYFPGRHQQYHHQPTANRQYDYGHCGGRVCASNGYRYASFANICRLNDYNLRLVFAGHAEFVEVDSIYCQQPPRDVDYYYRPQPAAETHLPGYSPHVPCIPMTRPQIGAQAIAQSGNAFAFSGYSSPALPYWLFKPPMSPTGPLADSKIYSYPAPHTSKRPVTYYYPTTTTKAPTTSSTNAPSTTTTTEASTTSTTNDPTTTTTTEASTTSTTNDASTTTLAPTTSTTNDPSTTTTTEASTTSTTGDLSTTTTTEASTTSTTNDPSTTTTTEASTTATTNDPSTTSNTEAPTTTTTIVPSTTTTAEASTMSTTNDPSTTTTTEGSTTTTTNNPSTTTTTTEAPTSSTTNDASTTTTTEISTTTTTNDPSTTTTTDASTTSTTTEPNSAVDPVIIQITGPNGRVLRLVLSDLAAVGSTCTESYTLDVTRGSTVLFQFTGCADADSTTTAGVANALLSASATTPRTNPPAYFMYHSSTRVIQTR